MCVSEREIESVVTLKIGQSGALTSPSVDCEEILFACFLRRNVNET